jgi:hypothetical protein
MKAEALNKEGFEYLIVEIHVFICLEEAFLSSTEVEGRKSLELRWVPLIIIVEGTHHMGTSNHKIKNRCYNLPRIEIEIVRV